MWSEASSTPNSICAPVDDIATLSLFASLGLREMDGTPKPALEVWMEFRDGR